MRALRISSVKHGSFFRSEFDSSEVYAAVERSVAHDSESRGKNYGFDFFVSEESVGSDIGYAFVYYNVLFAFADVTIKNTVILAVNAAVVVYGEVSVVLVNVEDFDVAAFEYRRIIECAGVRFDSYGRKGSAVRKRESADEFCVVADKSFGEAGSAPIYSAA